MSIPYFQVDTFTSRTFAGNPAGVCLLADWAPDTLLQDIAAENNLSETAFLVQQNGEFQLRWFTPTMEVDLCGHATLATTHVLSRHFGYRAESVRFETRSGPIEVSIGDDEITLDFPARPGERCEPPADLVEGLGETPSYTSRARDLLAVFESAETVRNLTPDFPTLERLDCLGVIATAPGDDHDFVSRFFAPRAGVPEDPVCGSAHCTLIPYWARRLEKRTLRAMQISARGGELHCEDHGDRVNIGGRAVTYSSGFLHVPIATGAR